MSSSRASSPHHAGVTVAGERANILVVDDRADKHMVFKAILEELDQNLVHVSSGEEALKEVLRRDFAVILLDVNMPGVDGFETASLIRGRKRSAHIPIIFITANYGEEARVAQAYALGAVDFMVSPIVPEILRSKVRVFVELFMLAQLARKQAEEHVALAAERAARAEDSPPPRVTESGLPQRRPGKQMVTPPLRQGRRPAAESEMPAERAPEKVRYRLSTYQRGLEAGRHRAADPEEAEERSFQDAPQGPLPGPVLERFDEDRDPWTGEGLWDDDRRR